MAEDRTIYSQIFFFKKFLNNQTLAENPEV